MSMERSVDSNPRNGGCCGGRGVGETLAELELQLHALWARIQEERAKQASADAPTKKKGCCCN